MNREKIVRLFGAGSGLVASALLIASGIVHDIEISATSSASTIAAAVVESQQSILIGAYLLMLGVFFLLFFVGYLRGGGISSADEFSWLANTGFGGGLIAGGMLLLSAHFIQSLTILQSYGAESQVAKALYLLDWNWYLLVEAIPIAVFIGANCAYALYHAEWPAWIAWTGIGIALLLLLPFVTGGGLMLSYGWLALLSIHRIFVENRAFSAAAVN